MVAYGSRDKRQLSFRFNFYYFMQVLLDHWNLRNYEEGIEVYCLDLPQLGWSILFANGVLGILLRLNFYLVLA